MKRRSVLLMFLVLLISRTSGQTPAKVIPDCTFYNLDGSRFLTSHIHRGKPSLFSFFDVTCSHCRIAIGYLSEHSQELNGISVFLVSLDGRDQVMRFMKVYGPELLKRTNVTILQDLNKEFIPRFQPLKYPSVFLYDKFKRLVVYEKDEKRMSKLLEQLKGLK